jgi:hypothetical protein
MPLPIIVARVRPIETDSAQMCRATRAKKKRNRTTTRPTLLGAPVPQKAADSTQAVPMTARTATAIHCNEEERAAVKNRRTENEESDPENLHARESVQAAERNEAEPRGRKMQNNL